MDEIWRNIDGYNGLYQISNLGHVRSFRLGRQKILKAQIDAKGYAHWFVRWNGRVKSHLVHRLVAEAFIPNIDNKNIVNHINGIKSDNRVENLEWATASENTRHAVKNGFIKSGGKSPRAKLTNEQVVYIRDNPDKLNQGQLAQKFSLSRITISYIQRGISYPDAGGHIRESYGIGRHSSYTHRRGNCGGMASLF